MGKNKDKKKKGLGAEKSHMKAEKKAKKKVQKELAAIGEDDIESMIAEFQAKDKEMTRIAEEDCGQPSVRSGFSLTAHPDKDVLVLFGGTYFNGSKTFMYNDLYFYYTRKNSWTTIKCPNPPPPRASHQAIGASRSGGQLWIFGGEFASPTQSQFYHYRDLWCFHLNDKKWEMISVPGGPSPRSGHRITIHQHNLAIFGGFKDTNRECKYYNDLYLFNLETYQWSKIDVQGTRLPSPRSGCALLSTPQGVLVFGGYSKVQLKKEVERGHTHTDMFLMTPGKEASQTKWRCELVKQRGTLPSPRCGFSACALPNSNVAMMFGGVFDQEDEDDLQGTFFNDVHKLELDHGKWFNVGMSGRSSHAEKKTRRKKKNQETGKNEEANLDEVASEEEGSEEEENPQEEASEQAVDQSGDEVFKLVVGGPSEPQPSKADSAEDGGAAAKPVVLPRPRMNAQLAVKNGMLYLYGGIYEAGEKQITLSDFYCLDVKKLDTWSTLVPDTSENQEWFDSSSGEDGEGQGEEGDDDDEEDDESDMEIDAPAANDGEPFDTYFPRTRDFWLKEACSQLGQEEGDEYVEKMAVEMAKLCFKSK